jgi:hypothetical protein
MKANYAGRCVRCHREFWRGDHVDPIPPRPGTTDWTYAHAVCPDPDLESASLAVTVARATCPCGNIADRGHHHCHSCRILDAAGRIADCSDCGKTYARISHHANTSPCCGAAWADEEHPPLKAAA